MAQIKDLLTIGGNKPQGFTLPIEHGLWYAQVTTPIPATTANDLWLIIPDIDPRYRWNASTRWPRVDVPSRMQQALVAFDNRQQLWVLALW